MTRKLKTVEALSETRAQVLLPLIANTDDESLLEPDT